MSVKSFIKPSRRMCYNKDDIFIKYEVPMSLKNRDLLLELIKDADDFASFKNLKCPPIYFLGGSGCILGNYLDRATFDLDFIDIEYEASAGKVFRLFDRFDMLDTYVTPIADGYEKRAVKLEGFRTLEYYVLSKEDIIVSKLGRYSDKDKEDIDLLMVECDRQLLDELIRNVINRKHFSERVRVEVIKNSDLLRKRYHV